MKHDEIDVDALTGFYDADEVVAGTDPEVAASFFSVTNVTSTSGNVEIDWVSVAGRTYDVLWTPELDSPFIPVATGIDYPVSSYVLPVGTNAAGFLKVNVRVE